MGVALRWKRAGAASRGVGGAWKRKRKRERARARLAHLRVRAPSRSLILCRAFPSLHKEDSDLIASTPSADVFRINTAHCRTSRASHVALPKEGVCAGRHHREHLLTTPTTPLGALHGRCHRDLHGLSSRLLETAAEPTSPAPQERSHRQDQLCIRGRPTARSR